jgi:hypothetical protein
VCTCVKISRCERRTTVIERHEIKIISFAEKFGNRAAQREFGILESNVRYWRKQKVLLEDAISDSSAFRCPKAGKSPYFTHSDISAAKLEKNCGNYASKYTIYLCNLFAVSIKWILERTAKVCVIYIYVTLHSRKIFQPYSITHYCDDINFVLAEAVLFWAVKRSNERNYRPNGYRNVFGAWSSLTLHDALLNFNPLQSLMKLQVTFSRLLPATENYSALLLRITCYFSAGADWMGTQSKVTINILLRILPFTEQHMFRLERIIFRFYNSTYILWMRGGVVEHVVA